MDDEPVQERGEATSISRIATLKHDTRDLSLVLERTDELSNEIHAAALEQRLAYRTVGITVVTTDMRINTRSKTLETPTNSLEDIKTAVKELLDEFLEQNESEARRVGVRISNFVKEQKNQRQLTSFMEHSGG
jgi:DNA polymerase-4